MILEPRARVPGFPFDVPSHYLVMGAGGPVFASLSRYAADQVAHAVRANGGRAWVSTVVRGPFALQWPNWARQGIAATLATGQSFFWGWSSPDAARYLAGVLADRTYYQGRRIRLDAFARAMGFS